MSHFLPILFWFTQNFFVRAGFAFKSSVCVCDKLIPFYRKVEDVFIPELDRYYIYVIFTY